MKNQTYNVDYFIQKFQAIPEELWLTERYGDGNLHCALGHCGCRDFNVSNFPTGSESEALIYIFGKANLNIAYVNDGGEPRYVQPTPKQRILAALYDIKKAQQSEPLTVIYNTIPSTVVIKELAEKEVQLS